MEKPDLWPYFKSSIPLNLKLLENESKNIYHTLTKINRIPLKKSIHAYDQME